MATFPPDSFSSTAVRTVSMTSRARASRSKITHRQYRREGLRYATDTTDEEWAVIAAHLPAPPRRGRPRQTPDGYDHPIRHGLARENAYSPFDYRKGVATARARYQD